MQRVPFTIATTVFALSSALPGIASHAFTSENNGVAIALGRHSSLLNADRSVNFDALDSHAESVIAKITRELENDGMNMRTVEDIEVSEIEPSAKPSNLPLLTHKKTFWYGTITIGTPPVSFSVELDTGSADLFVPAAACDSTCEGHTRWDPIKSKYAHPVGRPCRLEYADDAQSRVTGNQYTDNVTIAGFMANSQTFCAATMYAPKFRKSKFPADGLMGMAFPTISSYAATPVFVTLVTEKSVTNPVFSLNLTPTGGELYIGGANRALYKNDFTYTPVTKRGYWQVKVNDIQAKGKPVLNDVVAIIDTGCTLIIGDTLRVMELHEALGGKYYRKGFWTYPCDSFPDVRLTFNDKAFSISPETHNIGPVRTGSLNCFSGIISKSKVSEFWSIGGVFLQNVYTLFDYSNEQVGFAEHA